MIIGILNLFHFVNTATFFVNYDHPLIKVEYPKLLNLLFVLTFGLLILITLRRTSNDRPFSFLQTNQMKGLAIIIIVVHHLCFFDINQYQELSFWRDIGHVGVTIFLIVSGYGLCLSIQQKGLKNFFNKRIIKVYIPLLFAMILEVSLDHILGLSKNSILSDFANILLNVGIVDQNMWFVIFILFWYCMAYLVFRFNFSKGEKIFFLCFISLIFLSIPQILVRWKVNAFSFPLGFWLGLESETFVEKFKLLLRQNITLVLGVLVSLYLFYKGFDLITGKFYGYAHGLVGIVLAISLIIGMYLINLVKKKAEIDINIETIYLFLTVSIVALNYLAFDKSIPAGGGVAWYSYENFSAIFLASFIIFLVSLMVKFQVYSIFLNFIGKISYEVFLLHGMFMYSFDFILFRGNIAITFFIYFVVICLASIVLKKFSSIATDSLLQISNQKVEA